MLKKQTGTFLLIISITAVYITHPNITYGQCNKKIFYKMGKYAQTEGNEYIREFETNPKSTVNELTKTYKLKFNKDTEYTFYMSAKQSEFYAKMALYDSEHNIIDSVINQNDQEYYTINYNCKKTDMYIFEISGIKKKYSSKKTCIPAILTFSEKNE